MINYPFDINFIKHWCSTKRLIPILDTFLGYQRLKGNENNKKIITYNNNSNLFRVTGTLSHKTNYTLFMHCFIFLKQTLHCV